MLKKILICLYCAVLLGAPNVLAQIQQCEMSFDDCELTNDAETAAEGTLSGAGGSIFYRSQPKQTLNVVDAKFPNQKYAGTSMTEDGADKALELYIQSGSSSNSYFCINTASNTGLYQQKKVQLSFNMYVNGVNGGSHALIQASLYNSSSATGSIFAVRSSKKLQTFETNSKSRSEITYSVGKWYNICFVFDTQDKTYDLSIDKTPVETGALISETSLCFPGDPEATAANIIKEIRFQVNNGKNSTGSRIQIDDLYFGKVTDVSELNVSDMYFTGGSAAEATDIYSNMSSLGAKAELVYPAGADGAELMLAAAMYRNGSLEWIDSVTGDYSDMQKSGSGTLSLDIPISDLSADENCTFKLFLLQYARL